MMADMIVEERGRSFARDGKAEGRSPQSHETAMFLELPNRP